MEENCLNNFRWQSSNIYCIPKVHKCKTIQERIALSADDYTEVFQPEDLKARPIISGPESPTQRLSCLIENLLKPIVSCLTTYLKDDWEFLRFLPSSLNFDSVLYSCDIASYYTSIPIDLGIEAINYWIKRKRSLIPERFTKEFIIDSIKFILKNNNFLFDSKMFNQVFGRAMGTKCTPPYACLTTGY